MVVNAKKEFQNPKILKLFWFGGDKRDRTADLLNAIQALSQLSYTPKRLVYNTSFKQICQHFFLFLF